MAGLVPAIHVFDPVSRFKTWMPGIKPGMTKKDAMPDIKSLPAAELLRLYPRRELSPVDAGRRSREPL